MMGTDSVFDMMVDLKHLKQLSAQGFLRQSFYLLLRLIILFFRGSGNKMVICPIY